MLDNRDPPTVIFGIPGEVKVGEFRVAITPDGVRELKDAGSEVVIEAGAGHGAGIADEQYVAEGAELVATASEVFERSEVIVKVKEPQDFEVEMLSEDHVLFTYLHLAADLELTRSLVDSGATSIAYEMVEDDRGQLPLLSPMSGIAGRLAIQAGAGSLEKERGGAGVLLGGAPGVRPATVSVIGGGAVGVAAARVAVGMGARVTVLERDSARLAELEALFQGRLATCYSTSRAIEAALQESDLVIGAVLVRGARTPHVVNAQQLKLMRRGSAVVDVAIDQGGCFETSRPTTHAEPTFQQDGIVHYCVANMPGAVPVTATQALTNATLPYLLEFAVDGVESALTRKRGLLSGLAARGGSLTSREVGVSHGLPWGDPGSAIGAQN